MNLVPIYVFSRTPQSFLDRESVFLGKHFLSIKWKLHYTFYLWVFLYIKMYQLIQTRLKINFFSQKMAVIKTRFLTYIFQQVFFRKICPIGYVGRWLKNWKHMVDKLTCENYGVLIQKPMEIVIYTHRNTKLFNFWKLKVKQ